MKKRDQLLIVLSSYFYAILGLFFTGWWIWFLLIPIALVISIVGGKKRV